ncbi:MAG: asparagine synthase-related protein [Marivibrio sp.]|uniref:asparagine synthase-related protein n=1 Tax=Marivibrio sp. TaxID=2039719 RepID=UPI0032F05BD5
MIGIFGVRCLDPDRPAEIDAMSEAADPRRYRIERRAGRGLAVGAVLHRRGPSGGAAQQDGLDVVVCGEILNAAELSGRPDAAAASLILELYRADALSKLKDANGLFAAAICDPAQHRLVLVTDRFCSFPIHVHQDPARLAFAGQIAALLAEGRTPRKASAAGLAQLFTMQRTVAEDTNIAGVRALPAATIFTADRDGTREERYWSLEWGRAFQSEREAAEALETALRRAVARETSCGASTPGLLLSGGLDSRLILAASEPGRLACFTTASYSENPELGIARTLGEGRGKYFKPLVVEPSATLDLLDQTTLDSNGLYPASTQISAFMPAVGEACDVALTGHGLDYTFRGYYMPARFLEIAGSKTRLPALRGVPPHPTGADVLQNLRQGPPQETIDRIVLEKKAAFWWEGQAERLDSVLAPWLNSSEPLNAWDAFILHSLSKHYAFTGMMAVRAACNLRLTTYDHDVFNVYLGMPPAWRVRAGVALDAMARLSPDLARLPNANTGARSDLGPWKEVAFLLGRAALRRAGFVAQPRPPSAMHSAGSWQNADALYREDPAHREHFIAIRDRLDALTFGLLCPTALRTVIDEHLEGRRSHSKLLRFLMTHDSWVRQMGIAGCD